LNKNAIAIHSTCHWERGRGNNKHHCQ
jgi:hypothetical protein